MMTLLKFLNRARKEGIDITKFHVRMLDAYVSRGEGWGKGYQITSLRGNRLSIKTRDFGDFNLDPGHSALSSFVVNVRYAEGLSPGRLIDKDSSATLIIDVERNLPS